MSTRGALETHKPFWLAGGMLGLGIGYFISYTPYTGLARGVSEGLLPGIDDPVKGLQILPPSALGLLFSMVVFLIVSKWWRLARSREIAGVRVPFPGRETAASACFMAVIVGTTTLNFTFVGISILFVLVLERLETLVLAPSIDLVRRRKIHMYSQVALGLCAVAAVVTLADADNYTLSVAAALSILCYLAGYAGRFDIMSRHAKTGTTDDRRYFVEEHMMTPIMLTAALAVLAIIGQGESMLRLRDGFTTFFGSPTTPWVWWAFGIGVCYEALFIYTTHIFLDRRPFAFGMPVHVCASLLAGVAATFILKAMYGTSAPSNAQFVAAACVIGAAFALSYPNFLAWRANRRPARPAGPGERRQLVFVCGANTSRSPMAAAIAHHEMTGTDLPWQATSAGVNVTASGAGLSRDAAVALRELGVPVPRGHQSTPLTPQLCDRSVAVYCMTRDQRDTVVAMAPDAANRTYCLDAAADVPDPVGQPPEMYLGVARRIQAAVRARLAEQGDTFSVTP